MGFFSAITGGLGDLLGGGGGGGGLNVGGPGQHTNTNLSSNTSTNYASNNTNSGATFQTLIQGGSGPVTLTDQGTVAQSFNFATNALGQSYGVLQNAASAYNDTRDALQNAYQQSLSFVGKTTTPADESSQQRNAWLTFGAIAAVVLIAYAGKK